MADPADTLTQEQVDIARQMAEAQTQAAEATERHRNTVAGLNQSFERAINLTDKLQKGPATDALKKHLQDMQRELGKTGSAAEKAGDKINTSFDVDKMMNLAKGGWGTAVASISGSFGDIEKDFKKFSVMAGGALGDVGKAAKSLGAIGLVGLRKKAVDALDKIHYNEIQKSMYNVQRQAYQTGIAFGEAFGDAGGSVEGFNVSLDKTVVTTRSSIDTVLKVRGALKDAFAAKDTFSAITSLQDAMTGVKSAIDLTNVALTTSMATGADATEVARALADAHLELGLNIEDAALSMGYIQDATKNSGLHFENVSKSILGASKTLKYYGTTIEAVNPLFKTFNQSLRGIGREGLTPDLLNKFVGGLQRMQFNTRALLGLSMPGGRGPGGILGGGLKVEEALSTGKGMGDVVQGLLGTIKKFSAGPIMTRKEALETGSERDYVIQRQILSQLTQISDPGEANMMMQILKDIDKHGMAGSGDAVGKLKELMQQGEEVAEKTTADQIKAEQEFQATMKSQGGELVEIGKQLLTRIDKIGVRDFVGKMLDVTKGIAAGGTGDINVKTLMGSVTTLANEQADLASQLENFQGTAKEKKVIEKRLGEVKSQRTEQQVAIDYKKEIMAALKAGNEGQRRKYAQTGVAPAEMHERIWEKVTAKLDKTERQKLEKGPDALEKRLTKMDRPEEATGIRGKELRGAFTLAASREAHQRQLKRAEEVGVTLPGQKTAMELLRADVDKKRKLREKGMSEEEIDAQLKREAAPKVKTTEDIRGESDIERAQARQIKRSADARRREQRGDITRATVGRRETMVDTGTMTPPKQEIEGTITVKLEVDNNGNLVTTDKVVQIVKGEIRERETGAKTH